MKSSMLVAVCIACTACGKTQTAGGTVGTPEQGGAGADAEGHDAPAAGPQPGPPAGDGQTGTPSGGSAGGFTAAPTSWTGSNIPFFAIAADVDGDSRNDLVVLTEYAGNDPTANANVFLGRGDGTFKMGGVYAAGFEVRDFKSADFDRDGHADLIVSDLYGIRVLPGDGAGGFGAGVPVPTDVTYSVIRIGDFDRDGRPDIALSSRDKVYILRNTDGFVFRQTGTYAGPDLIAVADLDGDGRLDIVTGGAALFGNGDGTFRASATDCGCAVVNASAADLNGDGRADLVADVMTPMGQHALQVMLGRGDGTFASGDTIDLGFIVGSGWSPPQATLIDTTDVDGDGALDAIVLASELLILKGDGGGHLSLARRYAGSGPGGTTADFDGDGRVDVVTTLHEAFAFYRNLGHTDLLAAPSIRDDEVGAAVARDFNGDGIADIAKVDSASGTAAVLLGRGDGTFSDGVPVALGSQNGARMPLVAADLDEDGILDVLTSTSPSAVVLLHGNGDGTLSLPRTFGAITDTSYKNTCQIAVGDLDGDGHLDAVCYDGWNGLRIFRGTGNGNFASPIAAPWMGLVSDIAIGDVNGDGRADLIAASSTVAVYLGQPEASLAPGPTLQTPAGQAFRFPLLADVDGDGEVDLTFSGFDPHQPRGDGTVYVAFGHGDGSFAAPSTYAAGSGPPILAVGDFDVDGNADIAFVGTLGIHVLFNVGHRQFVASNTTYQAGGAAWSLSVADLNRDGRPDLVSRNPSGLAIVLSR